MAALVAAGCSSEQQPIGITDNSSSGGSDGSGGSGGNNSSHPAGTAGASGAGGDTTSAGDGGFGVTDGQPGALCSAGTAIVRVGGDGGASSCDFNSPFPGVSVSGLAIFADPALTMLIPQSASDGWTFGDAMDLTIALTGSYCDAFMAGKFSGLYFAYACGHPIP